MSAMQKIQALDGTKMSFRLPHTASTLPASDTILPYTDTEHIPPVQDSQLINQQVHIHHEQHFKMGEFVKSAVYGGLDGMVTTFTIALSSVGSHSTISTIIAFGVSSLIADGLSMGIADYLATKSDEEYINKERERESAEMEKDFEAEKAEMRLIYRNLGQSEANSAQIVNILATNREGFLDVMLVEELGLIAGEQSPFSNSIITFFAFALFGVMPLLPFLVAHGVHLEWSNTLVLVSGLLTLLFLFILGFVKSFVGRKKWYWSSLEAIVIGAVSAGVGFGIGLAFGEG